MPRNEYIDELRHISPKEGMIYLDGDTSMSPGTLEAALRATGGAVAAVDAVMTNTRTNAFVGTRPPGHHAETSKPMGFCFFDSAAIAARYAQRKYGISRACVVDFDVHHGNGSQEIFWSDPSVMYASTHRMPLFPGTGAQRSAARTITSSTRHCAPATAAREFREALATCDPAAAGNLRARTDRDLRRLRRALARPARQPRTCARKTSVGDAQADGNRRHALRRDASSPCWKAVTICKACGIRSRSLPSAALMNN